MTTNSALRIDADGTVTRIDVERNFKAYQEQVDGCMEVVSAIVDGRGPFLAVINEEGKLQGLPINPKATKLYVDTHLGLYGDFIAGTMVLFGSDYDDSEFTDFPTDTSLEP